MIIAHKKIKAKNPIFIAAWAGLGQVALKTVSYLKDALKAELFAEFDDENFFDQPEISIEKGLIELLPVPRGRFYFWKNSAQGSDLIIFISDQQPSLEKSMPYADEILNFVKQLGVKTIVTCAAILTVADIISVPKVFVAATHKNLLSPWDEFKVKPMDAGQVSGLNGFLLAVAKSKRLKGVCLLCEIPFYTSHMENPGASLEILKVMEQYLNIKISFEELNMAAAIIREEIKKMLEYFKQTSDGEDSPNPISNEDIEQFRNILSTQHIIPDSAKRQIEDLFSEAQEDPERVFDLKKKLDEWHVYPDYEDRFLSLFKERGINN